MSDDVDRVRTLIVDQVVVLDPDTGTLHRRGPGLTAACGLMPRVARMGAGWAIAGRATQTCPDCFPPQCFLCGVNLEVDENGEFEILCATCRAQEVRDG
jgi:hypothetical protein